MRQDIGTPGRPPPLETKSAIMDVYQIGTGNQQPVSSTVLKTYPKEDIKPNIPLAYIQRNLSPQSELWTTELTEKVIFGDWTGDGVTDVRYSDKITSYLPESGFLRGVNRNAGETWSRDVSSYFPTFDPQIPIPRIKTYHSMIGDFNGDALDDVAYQGHIYASTGLQFAKITQTAPSRQNAGRPNITQTADINSDGLDDIVIHNGYSDEIPIPFPYSYGSEIQLNTGTAFARMGFNGSTTISSLVGVGDFDGDGLTDFLIGGVPGKILFGQGGVPNLLTAVNGGRGERTEITYAPSSRFGYNQAPGVQQVVIRSGRSVRLYLRLCWTPHELGQYPRSGQLQSGVQP